MKVLLPTLGKPSSPTSAITLSSSRRSRFSPGSPGSARRGARSTGVAKCLLPRPPFPPFRDHGALVMLQELEQLLAGLTVEDDGPDRHTNLEVLTAVPVAVLTHPMLAVIGSQVALVGEVVERAEALVRDEDDVTAAAAVLRRGRRKGRTFHGGTPRSHGRRYRPRLLPHTRR